MLDRNKQYVVATLGHNLVSKAINILQKGDYSHVLVLMWSMDYNCWLVNHSTAGGPEIIPWEVFKEDKDIKLVFQSNMDLKEGLRKQVPETVGKYRFDIPALFGFLWVKMMWKLFTTKIYNPLGSPTAYICSEFIHEIFRSSSIEGYLEHHGESVDPDGVVKFMRDSEEFTEVIIPKEEMV